MRKVLMSVFLAAALAFIAGCKIQTPEIRGVALDAETKEPVADAWVNASLEIETKTVAGKVQSTLSMHEPHTRTDKQGRFVIPSKSFKKPPPPFGFGTEVVSFSAGAHNVELKGGHVIYYGGYKKRDFGKGAGDLKELIEKDRVEITIYVKPFEMTESGYFHHIQSLSIYCSTGRIGVEVPPVQGGCDAWELDFAITLHERYLERYKNPQIYTGTLDRLQGKYDRVSHYSLTLESLSYLYKEKGEYKKALDTFNKSLEFNKKWNITFNRKELASQINELEQLIQNKQPQP